LESIAPFSLCDYAHIAPWIILGVLLLGGLNFPISEDLVLILSGATASLCMPEYTFWLYGWTYAACCLASWETYWIGRLLGPKLYDFRWFRRFLDEKRISRLHHYYEKYGILVFIVGRFCPGGVRNALFLSSGLGKMPFGRYVLRDGFGALCSTACLFYLGYSFGINYPTVIHFIKTYDIALLIIILLIIILLYFFTVYKAKTNN